MLRDKVERSIEAARRKRGKQDTDEKLLDAVEDAAKWTCTKMEALMVFRLMMSRFVMETEGKLFDFMFLWFLGGLFSSKSQREKCKVSCMGTVDSATLQQCAEFGQKPFDNQVNEVLSGSSLVLEAKKSRIFLSAYFLYPQNEASKNPYKEVVDANKPLLTQKFSRLLRDLADLEEESYTFRTPHAGNCRRMKFSDPDPADMMELARVLKDKDSGLSILCQPKPLLMHMENFRLALLHARLWLLRAELPVCVDSKVSYKELRSGAFEETIRKRAEETFPSLVETQHMEQTAFAHSVLKQGKEVYHMKAEDYLPSARWKRPDYPLIIDKGKRDTSFVFLHWREGITDEEVLKDAVTVIATHEPCSRVLNKLRKLNSETFQQLAPGL